MQNHIIYLNVHPDETWEAKRAGAKYNERWKAHYTYAHHDNSHLKRWLPRQYHPDHQAPYLTINLIPETSYHKNLHKLFLCDKDWEYVRKIVYRNAGYRCEICGGRGDDHPVEWNEHWEFKRGYRH